MTTSGDLNPHLDPLPLAPGPDDTPARTRLHLFTGAMLVLLVVAAGVLAITRLRAAEGGADSPEAAVLSLIEAVGDEDVVGIADVLLPGERRTVAEPLLEAFDELVRLRVLAADFDPSSVGGLELGFDDVRTTVDRVADDLANVYVSGTFVASIDGRALPVGERIIDAAGGRDELDQVSEGPETEPFEELRITTVRHDGRWYVSIFHTIGEAVRLERGLAPVPLDAALVARGAAGPEAAFESFLDAVERLDVARMLSLVDPDEAAALHRYASLFLDDADRGAVESGLELSIDDVETSVERRGDRAHVILTGYRATVVVDDPWTGRQVTTMSYADGCTRLKVEYEDGWYDDDWYEDDWYEDDWYEDDWYEDDWYGEGIGPRSPFGGVVEADGSIVLCDDDLLSSPMMAAFPLNDLFNSSGLVFSRHGDEWFFSPVATYTESLLLVLRALDDQAIDELAEWWQSMFVPYGYSYGEIGYDDGGQRFEVIGEEIPPPRP